MNSDGQLGRLSSQRQSKHEISATNRGARELPSGHIAEEVSACLPQLVARNPDGSIEPVLYHFLAPMLLNEVPRQQRTIEGWAARIAALEQHVGEIAGLKKLTAQLAALLDRAGNQKGSARRTRTRERAGLPSGPFCQRLARDPMATAPPPSAPPGPAPAGRARCFPCAHAGADRPRIAPIPRAARGGYCSRRPSA